jgi:D-amino peptidase
MNYGDENMKILIAADMEGITGVVHWDHVDPEHSEYARFRRLMTQDVNAAINGAFSAGADVVTVTDGHANGRNILIEELDPRVHLHNGSPSLYSMVEGIQYDVDGVFFIGYHARAGTSFSSMDHTWTGKVIGAWINDQPLGEIGLNAAVCGHFNVPVLMISGEKAACAEAMELLGNLETAVVKRATSRFAAELLHPDVTQNLICDAAANAVLRLVQGTAPKPLKFTSPLVLQVEFASSELADQASVLPGAVRLERKVQYQADDMPTIYRAFGAFCDLAR